MRELVLVSKSDDDDCELEVSGSARLEVWPETAFGPGACIYSSSLSSVAQPEELVGQGWLHPPKCQCVSGFGGPSVFASVPPWAFTESAKAFMAVAVS